jgi:hypothetical protein
MPYEYLTNESSARRLIVKRRHRWSQSSLDEGDYSRRPEPGHNANVKRVAIFCSGGQLGVELKAVFTARKYEVACFERAKVDITDRPQVQRRSSKVEPDQQFHLVRKRLHIGRPSGVANFRRDF